jgi:flavorubredoxin
MQGKCTINDFLKAIQKHFGEVEYKATSKDGLVFKSKGWKDDKIQFDKSKFAELNNQIKRTRF